MANGAIENPWRILQVHNQYYSGIGGEDNVVALELEMLRKRDHPVQQLMVSTAELKDASPFKILNAAVSTPWSVRGYKLMKQAIAEFRPRVVHVHNPFPLLSTSIYWAAHAANVPVVQTLHNYRLICANGLILRNGLPCEKCIGHIPVSALRYRCYKDSLFATAPVFAMQMSFRMLRTAHRKVDAFIALTEFARGKLIHAGFPAEKIHVKPNFDRERAHCARQPGGVRQFVFLGRVIGYKGLDLLLDAWNRIGDKNATLLIAGDGPDKAPLERQFPNSESVRWLGWQDRETVNGLLDESSFLVLPARAFEGLPMVLVEALSAGTPSIMPRHGAFPQLLSDGNDGFLFEPRSVDSLTQVLRAALSLSEAEWNRMSVQCRTKFEQHYTEERNYGELMDIYKAAAARRKLA